MKKYTIYFMLLLFAAPASAQKGKAKETTGAQDRAFWVKSLYKISYPVIHNLANGTLKANMPLEKGNNYNLNLKAVTYTEALGRTLAGIAPWLELPDDDSEEGKLRKAFRAETLTALKNAVDPQNPDYLNFRTEAQPIVDAAYVAQAFLRAPKMLWQQLDPTTQKGYIEEFKSLRTRTGAYNNWLLFAAITEGFLWNIGEQYDPARLRFGINKLNEWYEGDGWYSDGSSFSMDYYNSFVIHPMMVDLLKSMLEKKRASVADYNRAVDRMARYASFLERSIAPDGTFPAFGRSITYRTAAFQALAQTALMEKLPEGVNPSQVRCALTKVFHLMYEGNQNFDKDGWLVLGFNGHQPEVADVYTSTGSLYMATLGFLALGLPADNKFWADPPAPWTSQKAWSGQALPRDHRIEN